MTPRVAKRGRSFKGAGLYYLHDKKAKTSERVAWTYVYNLPTTKADKAFGYMAYTAMSADRLKAQAGVPLTGRKATAGAVYSFSLSWHPEQDPQREVMEGSALQVLSELGLYEHEAVIVAHNDEPHPHVHVIANLVHPETGKTASISYDFLSHSRWAENFEKSDGKVYCEQRIINNAQRKAENREKRIIKYREQKLAISEHVQSLYQSADNGQSFRAAMREAGYELAEGDRRGFVLVDPIGKTHSLSRQLKGVRAKDMRAKLNDIQGLPHVDLVQQQRTQQADTTALSYQFVEGRRRANPYTDTHPMPQTVQKPEQKTDHGKAPKVRSEPRPKTQKQTPIVKHSTQDDQRWAAMLTRITKIAQKEQVSPGKDQPTKTHVHTPTPDPKPQAQKATGPQQNAQPAPSQSRPDDHLQRLDAMRTWERKMQIERERLDQQQRETYNRDDLRQQIRTLETQRQKANTWHGKLTGKRQKIEDELTVLRLTLTNANQRIEEQNQVFERKMEQTRPGSEYQKQRELERQQALDHIHQPRRDRAQNKGHDGPRFTRS